MGQDSDSRPWSRAVDNALDSFGRAVVALLMAHQKSPSPPKEVVDNFEAANAELCKILGSKDPLTRGRTLLNLVVEELLDNRSGDGPLSEAYERAYPHIRARVQQRLPKWAFAVPLGLWSGAPALGPFGIGSLAICESEYREDEGPSEMDLVGVIAGPALRKDAVRDIERRAIEFFGACVALGLADLREPGRGWWDVERVGQIQLKRLPDGNGASLQASHRFWWLTAAVRFDQEAPLSRLTDLERHEGTEVQATAARRTRLLGRLLGGDSDRHLELRNACRLFLEAYGAADYGTSVLYGFLCLESVLLDARSKADVLARLTEAVAYRAGRSAGERQVLRALVKQLYDDRSTYVHTGRVEPREDVAQQWTDLLARILGQEIAELDS